MTSSMRKTLLALTLAVLATACSGGNATPSPSNAAGKPPVVSLLVNNVELSKGRDAPLVIGVDVAGRGVSVIVKHAGNSIIDVFALSSVDEPLPDKGCPLPADGVPSRTCINTIGSGVRETVEAPVRARAIAILLRSAPETVNLRLDYDERSREVSVHLPTLAPVRGEKECEDNGCNPFLEMMPVRSGDLRASARFASGTGHLQLLQGTVIGRSARATGIPYRIPAEKIGTSPLEITSRLDSPAEYALAFLNRDPANPVSGIVLEARWP